jgi:esterase/lipase superfamily enzyme
MWRREHAAWDSPALGGPRMDVLVYGHAGARVLVFPTSQGSVHEWEDFGMMAALDEHLSRGWLQLFCVGSVDAESWYARWRAPHDRVCWHDRYDRYIRDEVLPFTASMNGNPFLIATGASFGAYHAMSFATRYPDRVGRVVAMSGLYDITLMTDGYTDGLLYFHNPCAFLRHEHDPARMAALRAMDLIIVTGREDSLCWNSEQLSGILWERGIGNALRLWDGWAHDWPWWQQMIRHYIGGQD